MSYIFAINYVVFSSALVTSGMTNLCKSASLPPMTVPFNLIGLLLFVCLPSGLKHLAPPVTIDNSTVLKFVASPSNGSEFGNTVSLSLDWIMVKYNIQAEANLTR